MTDHDMTRPTWGRNVSLMEWKPEDNHASGFCWLTPGPKDGDILLIQGKKSVIRLKLYDVRWMGNVDDMYSFKAVPPELPIPTATAEK